MHRNLVKCCFLPNHVLVLHEDLSENCQRRILWNVESYLCTSVTKKSTHNTLRPDMTSWTGEKTDKNSISDSWCCTFR